MERRVRVGVYGIAEVRSRVLLTRLSAQERDSGKWTLPGGGMDFGETPHETLIREFHEETGLVPSVGGIVDVISFVPRPELQVIQMIFEVEARGEPRVVEVDGSTVDARWVPTAELGSLRTVGLVDHVTALRGW